MERRFWIFLFLILAVSGCATTAQRQLAATNQTFQSATAELSSCTSAVYNSPEAAPLRPHSPFDVREATLEQMMDASKVTAEEIEAIRITHPRTSQCRRHALEIIMTVTPGVAVILADLMQKRDRQLIELIQQEISWGAFVTTGKDEVAATNSKLVAEFARIMNGLELSHQNELARRQAAANAMMQYYQSQQVINALNRPSTTNCTAFGNSVNCVTQ